jgi:hypothetical protein
MSDPTDIAARTQRFRDAVRAFTPPPPKRYTKLMPLKDGIVELREKGASLRLIRELLLTVDVSVSMDTIARFLAEVNSAKMKPRAAKQSGQTRNSIPRTNGEQSATAATPTEPLTIIQQPASPPQTTAPSERTRTRGPRVADPRNL